MVQRELTWENLIRMRKKLKEQQKELGGHNQMVVEFILSRSRAT
jgi:hypothetical protein